MLYLFLVILILNIINVYSFCKINYSKQKIPDLSTADTTSIDNDVSDLNNLNLRNKISEMWKNDN